MYLHPGMPLAFVDGLQLSDVGEFGYDPAYQRPCVEVELTTAPMDDETLGLTTQALTDGIEPELIGRSGHSRVGVHVVPVIGGYQIEGSRVRVRARVLSFLRADGASRILQQMRLMHQAGTPVHMGRILLRRPDGHLGRDQIAAAIAAEQMLFPEGYQIADDGTVLVPRLPCTYEFNAAGLTEERIRRLLDRGKHALDGIQALSHRAGDLTMQPGEFLVTGMQLAFGGFQGVIDAAVSDGVEHLGARMLDGMRTTGFMDPVTGARVVRQLELVNRGATPARGAVIPVRFYGDPEISDLARTHVSRDTLCHGVGISHVIAEHGGILAHLLQQTIGDPAAGLPLDAGAVFLAGGRILACERGTETHPDFHADNRLLAAEAVVANADYPGMRRGKAVPEPLRPLTRLLDYVGGQQNSGKVMVVARLPGTHELNRLFSAGIRTFVFRYFNNASNNTNNVHLDALTHAGLVHLRNQGANFIMLSPAAKQGTREWRIFDRRGLFTRPQAMARMDRVDTVLSFYGSNVTGTVAALRPGVEALMQQLRSEFGDTVAVTHGAGPGVMLLADESAAQAGIVRIGVGIGVEKLGQVPNHASEATLHYHDIDRLSRQDKMDSILTFSIFLVGGLGTLEEEAIRLCSQKLGRGLVTPMIFVDPFGLGRGGEHIWADFHREVATLSADAIARDLHGGASDTARGLGLDKVLLADLFSPHYLHLVQTPQEAAQIVIAFARETLAYYDGVLARTRAAMQGRMTDQEFTALRHRFFMLIARGYLNAEIKATQTGFSIPAWYPREKIRELREHWEVTLDPNRDGDVIAWFDSHFPA